MDILYRGHIKLTYINFILNLRNLQMLFMFIVYM